MGAHDRRSGRPWVTPTASTLIAVGVLLAALTAVAFGRGALLGWRVRSAQTVAGSVTGSATRPGRGISARTADATVSSASSSASPAPTASGAATPAVSSLATRAASSPAPPTAPRPATPTVKAPVKASVDAYRGLGSWVDIWDEKAWKDPATAVRDMKRHGVRTLYLETGNSRAPEALKNPAATATFIRTAHALDMRVVAWYLPDLQDVGRDYGRIEWAIRFRTPDGQKFDSFALDIESPAVKFPSIRNSNLATLSRRIRAAVGPSYPLGAIIPSPVGLARNGSYWSTFPYEMVADMYDVFVPMSYYTWHGDGGTAALADTLANVRILRGQKGVGNKPVHLIGGIAQDSSPAEVRAFVQAAQQTGAIGASLYSWPATNDAHWEQLKAVKR